VIARPTDKDEKPLLLQALTHTKVGGSRADVTIASSLVAHTVLAGEVQGQVNLIAVGKATAAVDKNLTRETIPDMTNRAAILATVDQLAKDVAEIRVALDDVRRDLADIKSKLDELVNKLNQNPVATPTTPIGVAGTPGTEGTASPVPRGTPDSVATATPPLAGTATPDTGLAFGNSVPPFDSSVPLGWWWFIEKAGTASYYKEDGKWVAVLKNAEPSGTGVYPYGLKRTIKGNFMLELEASAESTNGNSILTQFAGMNAGRLAFTFVRASSDATTRRFAFGPDVYPMTPAVKTQDTDSPDQFSMKFKRLNNVLRAYYRDGWTGDYIQLAGDVVVGLPEEAEFSISFLPNSTATVRFKTIRLTQ
jgi:hypothetical protein